jgi:hypothetical protein
VVDGAYRPDGINNRLNRVGPGAHVKVVWLEE